MLTYKQAIKLIGYSRKGCYKLIKQGKLKVLKIGKRLFVEESEVEKFLEKKNQDKQPEGYKKCSLCQVVKLKQEFKNRRSVCKICYNNLPSTKESRKRSYKKHREKLLAKGREHSKKYRERRAIKDKLRNYNITEEQYYELINKSNGLCDICSLSKPLGIDHNHTTGKIRGLLCNTCNVGIGLLKDDLEILENAIRYLKQNDG